MDPHSKDLSVKDILGNNYIRETIKSLDKDETADPIVEEVLYSLAEDFILNIADEARHHSEGKAIDLNGMQFVLQDLYDISLPGNGKVILPSVPRPTDEYKEKQAAVTQYYKDMDDD